MSANQTSTRRASALFAAISLTVFSAILITQILIDMGKPQPAFTLGCEHVVTLLAFIGIPAICGFFIGRGGNKR